MTVESLAMSTVKLLADQVEHFFQKSYCQVNKEAQQFIVENVQMN